ncbi:MAG: FecR domain-containing protein [Saprospiraceae bacterium]|nr:FecR domain-containing protein [Saprospiraceae bacterium]
MFESNKIDKELYIHKFLTDALSFDEKIQFQQWLQEDIENKVMFSELSELWNSAAIIPDNQLFDSDKAFAAQMARIKEEINKPQSPTPIFSLKSGWFVSAAALMVIVLSTVFVLKFYQSPEIFQTKDEPLLFVLDDNSEVWLNVNSILKVYSFKKNERKIELMGEAFIDVVQMKEKPFIVSTKDFDITVVGTSFKVNTENKDVFVKSGIVRMSNSAGIAEAKAGERFFINSGDTLRLDTSKSKLQLDWVNRNLTFDNAALATVIRDIELKFNIKIDYSKSDNIKNCGFTSGSLKDNSLDEIVALLRLTYDMEITRSDDNTYRITSVKCR